MWLWLRRLVRQNTRPIPLDAAEKWNKRFSFAYNFFAWNAGGLVLYLVFTGGINSSKYKEDQRLPSQKFADLLGIKKAHVVHVSGFRKTQEFDIDNTMKEAATTDTPDMSPENSVM